MPEPYDFAIFGGNALSALLAGLLAHDHGRRVIRVAEPVSPQRLPRRIDIALPFASRPASWALLRRSEAETLRLFKALGGRDEIGSTAVMIVTDLPETATALAHMRHMAAGYGLVGREGLFEGVSWLRGEVSLADSRVRTVESAELTESGIRVGGEAIDIGRIVLADDTAILAHVAEDRLGPLLPQASVATLTAPAQRLDVPIMRFADRGVTLLQRPDLTVLGLVSGEAELEARLASCLPGPFPLQRRATSHFRSLMSADGAPVIGDIGRFFVIAGLGDASAFLAPPLARVLAGKIDEDEAAWIAAHGPAQNRAVVADIGGVLP